MWRPGTEAVVVCKAGVEKVRSAWWLFFGIVASRLRLMIMVMAERGPRCWEMSQMSSACIFAGARLALILLAEMDVLCLLYAYDNHKGRGMDNLSVHTCASFVSAIITSCRMLLLEQFQSIWIIKFVAGVVVL